MRKVKLLECNRIVQPCQRRVPTIYQLRPALEDILLGVDVPSLDATRAKADPPGSVSCTRASSDALEYRFRIIGWTSKARRAMWERTVSKGAPRMAMSYGVDSASLSTKQLTYGIRANVVRPENWLPLVMSILLGCPRRNCSDSTPATGGKTISLALTERRRRAEVRAAVYIFGS